MVEVEDDSASIRSHASDQQGAFLLRRIFCPYIPGFGGLKMAVCVLATCVYNMCVCACAGVQ